METMMFATRSIAAVLIFTIGSAAIAQPPPAQGNPPIIVVGEKPPHVDKVECKTLNTGTLIPKRVCMPESEWSDAEKRSRDALRSMRDWQRMRCRYGSIC
jgi:hypothetical protein